MGPISTHLARYQQTGFSLGLNGVFASCGAARYYVPVDPTRGRPGVPRRGEAEAACERECACHSGSVGRAFSGGAESARARGRGAPHWWTAACWCASYLLRDSSLYVHTVIFKYINGGTRPENNKYSIFNIQCAPPAHWTVNIPYVCGEYVRPTLSRCLFVLVVE